jgi:hypothetical protein
MLRTRAGREGEERGATFGCSRELGPLAALNKGSEMRGGLVVLGLECQRLFAELLSRVDTTRHHQPLDNDHPHNAEKRAGFADRFKGAVQLRRTGEVGITWPWARAVQRASWHCMGLSSR